MIIRQKVDPEIIQVALQVGEILIDNLLKKLKIPIYTSREIL